MAREMTTTTPRIQTPEDPSSFPSLPSLSSTARPAQFASLLSAWERPGEGACISAKLEQAIKANLRGQGYGSLSETLLSLQSHPSLKTPPDFWERHLRCLAPSGLGLFLSIEPRALPWAGLSRPFGAAEGGDE